jgi:hypothetical protein
MAGSASASRTGTALAFLTSAMRFSAESNILVTGFPIVRVKKESNL